MDFLENQTKMNFLENRMGATVAQTNPENAGSKKKQFFWFSFAWIFLEIKQ